MSRWIWARASTPSPRQPQHPLELLEVRTGHADSETWVSLHHYPDGREAMKPYEFVAIADPPFVGGAP